MSCVKRLRNEPEKTKKKISNILCQKLKVFFSSPHIQIALATGFSIILMAIFSKRILSEPIGYLSLAIPPFIAAIFELLFEKHKDTKFLTSMVLDYCGFGFNCGCNFAAFMIENVLLNYLLKATKM